MYLELLTLWPEWRPMCKVPYGICLPLIVTAICSSLVLLLFRSREEEKESRPSSPTCLTLRNVCVALLTVSFPLSVIQFVPSLDLANSLDWPSCTLPVLLTVEAQYSLFVLVRNYSMHGLQKSMSLVVKSVAVPLFFVPTLQTPPSTLGVSSVPRLGRWVAVSLSTAPMMQLCYRAFSTASSRSLSSALHVIILRPCWWVICVVCDGSCCCVHCFLASWLLLMLAAVAFYCWLFLRP